jgi:ABC-type branched-subunit amino acid transport system permease subunit
MVAFWSIVAPFVLYPVFLMKALCFALFACAFNLLIGYVGLVSFGHALYFGWASYFCAYAAKSWGCRRNSRSCLAPAPPPSDSA